ncbi:hypothetical protein [Janthinobacterium sp.]|uniref:hypothetical protein n=1 Tax=Janthinobacterium sp. TaxID=1871054 RepID=UPI00293D7403|nr:hypothetical protein [Janthinobacterium sp.]
MKSFQIALLVALLLPLGGNALADSRPTGKSSGSSSSYKSGFSSQRGGDARPASGSGKSSFGSFGGKQPAAAPRATPSAADEGAAPARPKSGFGSFGGARGDAAAPAKSDSALSRELEQKSANANALKTLDARRAAAAAPPPLPPLNPMLPPNQAPGYNQAQQPYNQAQQPYNQPQQQAPVVVQQSNGLGGAVAGYMLGRAMNGGSNHGGYNNGAYGNGGNNGNNGNSNGGNSNGGVAGAPPAVPQASFGGALLRTFVWLAVLGALGWLIYYGVKRLRAGKARSAANYSFERE